MKSKQKPFNHYDSVYYEQAPTTKRKSQYNVNDQSYHELSYNRNSHLPISSSITQSIMTESNPSLQYQTYNNQNFMFNSNIKSNQNITKQSPYMHLPTLSSGNKIQSAQGFYIQDQSSKKYLHQNFHKKEKSIYDQIAESRQFGMEIDPNIHLHLKHNKNINSTRKSPYDNSNHISTQRHLNNKYLPDHPVISPSCHHKNLSKDQQLRREIDGKLERVCEKVGLMSLQKGTNHNNNVRNSHTKCMKHGADKSKMKGNEYCRMTTEVPKENNNNCINSNSNNTKQLCYSSIVYKPSINQPTTSFQLSLNSTKPSLTNQTNDNSIHHRIVQDQPPLIQIYEQKIIELQKRVSLQHIKIQSLEQDLLKQRQSIIKKQKQWLLRENQLLNWIEENEREIEEMKLHYSHDHNEDEQQNNIVVIDERPIISSQSQNLLCEQLNFQQSNISTHRNNNHFNNPRHTKKNSASKYSSHHNQSILSLSETKSNQRRHNNLLQTHKKNTNHEKTQTNGRIISVGVKNNFQYNEVFYPSQPTSQNQPYQEKNNFLLSQISHSIHQTNYDLYQLICLQAKSLQSLISHQISTPKIIPSFEQQQEQNLLVQAYHHHQSSNRMA